VEAAFMRRAGWKVYLASELRGSYEEVPPSLISYAARDRRWCQGNMQHAGCCLLPGLHPVNRLHLSWESWLFGGAVVDADVGLEHHRGHSRNRRTASYFPSGPALHPVWKIPCKSRRSFLFLAVMGLLMAPKVLSLLIHLRNREKSARLRRRRKFALSVLVETWPRPCWRRCWPSCRPIL
jgi:membrane glycosyltransferase